MNLRRLRQGFAVASSLGAAAMAVVLLLGVGMAGPASAAITLPPFPGQAGAPVSGFGEYPWWLPQSSPGVDPISNVDNSEGSDATLYVMETIGSLYNNAGVTPFSCTITKTADSDCQQPSVSTPNPDNTQSDETDNFSGSEELQGTNDVGSGNGQAELCGGTPAAPAGPLGVDYARSSRPVSTTTCPTGVDLGFAKDSVVATDFQAIDPALYGAPTGYLTQTDPQCSTAGQYPSYSAANGTVTCTAFPAGGIGPVAAGWLPTDPTNCTINTKYPAAPTAGECTGAPFTDIDNTAIGGGTGATSVAYRLFCQHGPSATPNTSQITDWGQLTNLGGNPVGNGTPIGVPIRIIGVNTGQATATTFYSFAQSGITNGTNCSDTGTTINSSTIDPNAASGPDPEASQGPAGGSGNNEIALESDASQIGDFANANWPNDSADQATDIATSLYFVGYGAYTTNNNAIVASIEGGTIPAGDPSSFTEKYLTANSKSPSIATERNDSYPMARTLFNIYRTDTVRASTAGFLDWLCDSNSAIQKGTNHVSGGNFDTDLTNIINGTYGFSRLTDATPELPVANQTPADNVPGGGVNGTCGANLAIASGGITVGSNVITLTNPVPPTVKVGWEVEIPNGSSVALGSSDANYPTDSTDTITAIGPTGGLATDQIQVTSNAVAGTGTSAPTTVYFPGQAPVLAVNTLGS
jgi:hypothetical protein